MTFGIPRTRYLGLISEIIVTPHLLIGLTMPSYIPTDLHTFLETSGQGLLI